MKDKLFIVVGTGFSIDRTVVSIVADGGDGYKFVAPYKTTVAETSIKIHEKYLQPIDKKDEYIYDLEIVKHCNGSIVDRVVISTGVTLKNVSSETIGEFLENDLFVHLRME